jgi:hypothetical protein
LFGWALSSAWTGCDSISAEKREGTIGLLFLTDLKSHDIVLGKMFASALPSFYAALAVMPLLAICMLMGGVTAAQYAETGLAILNVFFLAQAVGVFSSALCRVRGNAVGMPFLILLLYLMCSGIVGALAKEAGWMRLAYFLQLNNPAHPFYWAAAGSAGPATVPGLSSNGPGYWLSLLVAHLHGWIFLGLACWVLPRCWRDKPQKTSGWNSMWRRLFLGSRAARAALGRRLINVNPFTWLACRGQISRTAAWSAMGLFAVIFGILPLVCEIVRNDWRDDYSQARRIGYSGVRPSPGAASPHGPDAGRFSEAGERFHVAAPGDGRTPPSELERI